MVTSLTELIVSLRKLNPTFTDDVLRSHLINLGNSKEAVDDALRVVNGIHSGEIVENANRDMSKGVVFEEEQNVPKKTYGYDGGPSFLGKTVQIKKHHRIRNFFIFILFMIAFIMGTMYYFGTLTINDFKGIKIEWSKWKDVEYLKKVGTTLINESSIRMSRTIMVIKSKFFVQSPGLSEALLVLDNNNTISSNIKSDTSIQIQKVNRLRAVLNTYAGVYGDYPLDISEVVKMNINKDAVKLPLLTEGDISDTFSNKIFTYVKDPKTGFNLSYNMRIEQDAIESQLFYDLVEYRLVYNTKTKTSSFIPIFKYVNGINTATRDSVSLEAIRMPAVDTNKNLVPDLLE